jgi:superfamily II DNA or RNA helicase
MQQEMFSNPPGILAGWMFVPYWALDDGTGLLAGLRREKGNLTFKSRFADREDPPIRLYRDMPARRLLGVPRAYGVERFPWLDVADRMSAGQAIQPTPKRPNPNHPSVKEPDRQRQFMQDMRMAADLHGSFIAMAATGSGKTVVSLDTAAEKQRKTLILVHLERLRDQWLDEIMLHLGLSEDKIGTVQGTTCDYIGKDFVVGMMPSLSMRSDYPADLFTSFGTVIIDEVHRVGSPLLSKCVPLFTARNRWGLSATPKRKDGNDKVGFWHIGPIRVQSEAKALECTVYVKRFSTLRGFTTSNPMMRPHDMAEDKERNVMLVDLIKRSHAIGRQGLVIGKFVDHLQHLMDGLAYNGVPIEDMGLYTGEQLVREWQVVNGVRRLVTTGRVKTKKSEFERIKAESQLIFATYGMFKEGIDVPRLDFGIDVLPQGEAIQVIGRIRRPSKDKLTPYWITIVDEKCTFSRKMFDKRQMEYRRSGCQIVESNKI